MPQPLISSTSNRRYTVFSLLMLATIGLGIIMWLGWWGDAGEAWKSIINGDGRGYYAYLDQIFNRGNFGHAPIDHDIVHEVDNSSVIKFFGGTALLWLPFFGLSKLVILLFNIPPDAAISFHSKILSISSLCYYLLGSIALLGMMRRMGVNRMQSMLSIYVFFLGTNLLLYVLLLPSMSHSYSFFAVSCFLYFSYRAIEKPSSYLFIVAGLFFGLIYLIRPLNMIVVLFLPFFFNNFSSCIHFIKSNFRKIIAGFLCTAVVGSIQHFLWYAQCGHFFIWTYQNEGFYFLNPEFFNFLFSFRKGLLIYTPLLVLPLLGSLIIFRTNKYKALVFLVFFLIILYVLSSWWCWTYADGYGSRAVIEFYPIFLLVFALILKSASSFIRYCIIGISLIFIGLNLIQSYQYTRGIIHTEYMNYESYRHVFLKTSSKYSYCIGGVFDLPLYDQYKQKLIIDHTYNYHVQPGSEEFWDPSWGDSIVGYDNWREFGNTISITKEDALMPSQRCWALIDFDKLDPSVNAASEALLVVSISYSNPAHKFYYSCRLNYLPGGVAQQWRHSTYSIILPEVVASDYKINFYISNQGWQHFLIKNFRVRIYETIP